MTSLLAYLGPGIGADTNVGGLSLATQAVSGVLGVARNDANTCCAQRDESTTARE